MAETSAGIFTCYRASDAAIQKEKALRMVVSESQKMKVCLII